MLTVQDCGRSAYLLFQTFRTAGFPADRASRAVDALLSDVEPAPAEDDQVGAPIEWSPIPDDPHFDPAPEDEAWWADQIDREATLDALSLEIQAADRFDAMMRIRRREGRC